MAQRTWERAAVWDRIKDSDSTGLEQYTKLVRAANVSASTQEVQQASHPVDLVQEAAMAKPVYDKIISKVVDSVKISEAVGDDDIQLNIPNVRGTHTSSSFGLHTMSSFIATKLFR